MVIDPTATIQHRGGAERRVACTEAEQTSLKKSKTVPKLGILSEEAINQIVKHAEDIENMTRSNPPK